MILQAFFSTTLLISALAVGSASAASPSNTRESRDLEAVNFPAHCAVTASELVEKGVYQMHHMMYGLARDLFQDAATKDPECVLAVWGEAMTYIHPLWLDRPTPEILALGSRLTERALALGGGNARQQQYLTTIEAYFQNGDQDTEAERLKRFEAAWKDLHESHPEDQEAKAFYALAQIATADPTDKSHAQRIAAGTRAEEVLAAAPNHPGAQHYIIHAFDVPGLAERALPVARQYGVVAPEVPHALHMMSHIFTRLGLWDESVEWNRRSAAAAWKVGQNQGAISMHYLHALDYLVYAHLQKGEDDQALAAIQTMSALKPPFGKLLRVGQAYAFAAAPARYVLERQDWQGAAILSVRAPREFPWEPSHAPFVALTHFARGLGLAHIGRFAEADREVLTLGTIEMEVASRSAFWSNQVRIQKLATAAWVRFLRGDQGMGLSLMKQAATLEDATEKKPVTPGEVLPANELLGDMLMILERYDEAAVAYRTVLARSPRRLNSLYGSGRALALSGDPKTASTYFEAIVKMAGESSERSAIVHARTRTARGNSFIRALQR